MNRTGGEKKKSESNVEWDETNTRLLEKVHLNHNVRN